MNLMEISVLKWIPYFEQQKQLNSEESLDFFLIIRLYYIQLVQHNDVL